MAKGKKTGGRDFEVGHPGGPGQPKLPDKVKKLYKLSAAEVEEMVSVLLGARLEDLKAINDDPNSSAIKIAIVQVLKRAIKEGNMNALDGLLNRVVGKVKEKIEHEGIAPRVMILHDGREVHFVKGTSEKDE